MWAAPLHQPAVLYADVAATSLPHRTPLITHHIQHDHSSLHIQHDCASGKHRAPAPVPSAEWLVTGLGMAINTPLSRVTRTEQAQLKRW